MILPTGEIFIEGGLKNGNNDATAVRAPESYNPATGPGGCCPRARSCAATTARRC